MKTCARCQSANAAANRFCQHCGLPLDLQTPAPAAAGQTVRWSSGRPPVAPPRRFVPVAMLFGTRDRLVIGRAPDCDVCLPHPTISRYHALLERGPDGLRLSDLGSVNGVSVAGVRIAEPVPVRDGERVGIGPYLFTLRDGLIQSLDSSRSLRLEAHLVEKAVPLPHGQTRKLLDGVSLVVEPGEFVTLLGPSGSGKSTLMDCLNGRRRATGGSVRANGEDFYRHFDSFRQSLGYVPQRDIVHTQLTVLRALYYTARLRLPKDTEAAEMHARLEKVLAEMELGPHRDTLVGNLSGGQVKRVSLGAELLAEPCLLYIDEATSGLDAGTEARMMRLFRRLADEGRSLICITHTVEHVDQCHLVLVLCRGRLVYYGPPAEAPRWFGVARLGEVYDRLAEREPHQWAAQFAGSELYQEFVANRLAAGAVEVSPTEAPTLVRRPVVATAQTPVNEKVPSTSPPLAERIRALTARYLRARVVWAPLADAWHQLRVLTARYVELIRGDPRSLRLLLWQAPLVAFFLLVGFVNKDYDAQIPIPRPLEPGERRVLEALAGVDQLLAEEAPDADLRQALQKVHFRVEVAGKQVDLDGTRVVRLLRVLQRQSLEPLPHAALAETRVHFDAGGKDVTLNCADLATVFSALRQSRLPDKLLAFDGPVVPDRTGTNPRYTYILLFIVVMVVLWFGCNNAAKEIVKEEAVYGRERAVNLGITPYLASKFLVQSAVTFGHALVLMVLVFGTLQVLAWLVPGYSAPPRELRLGYPAQLGVLAVLAMCGVALGLFISACVSSPDRANALLPYVLIPQIILGGGILSVDAGPLRWLAMALSPVYWAYRAVRRGGQDLPAGFPGHVAYPDGALWPCAVLLLQTAVLLVFTAWFLRRKDA
jgi:ABC-type multidrug transport system ATPase subunit